MMIIAKMVEAVRSKNLPSDKSTNLHGSIIASR